MAAEGFHPAETWHNASPEALDYYLQVRWYIENIRSWQNEPGDEISIKNIPRHNRSERPRLIDPEGYKKGRKTRDHAVIYKHPQGLPPAQTEVWIDADNDGRFNPDPEKRERILMQAHGTDFKEGVLYTVTAEAGTKYVFRFADKNWNPPVSSGLVPGKATGISYVYWE
jgi:hypothetical protein